MRAPGPEPLSHETLDPIAAHGLAHLPGHRDAEARCPCVPSPHGQRDEKARGGACTRGPRPLKIGPAQRRAANWTGYRAVSRRTLAHPSSFGRPVPSGGDPWRAAWRARPGRPGSSSAPESHESAGAGSGWAGTSASSVLPRAPHARRGTAREAERTTSRPDCQHRGPTPVPEERGRSVENRCSEGTATPTSALATPGFTGISRASPRRL
jgi:hypothetical protein